MTQVSLETEIVRETEKAICIDYARERMVWLPKSCVEIVDGIVYAKSWVAKKNGIGCHNQRRALVG